MTSHRFNVAFEPRQSCGKRLLGCHGVAPVEPRFERFDEYF
jgi:hypothetical protein